MRGSWAWQTPTCRAPPSRPMIGSPCSPQAPSEPAWYVSVLPFIRGAYSQPNIRDWLRREEEMLGVNRRGISNSCFNNATSNMFRIVYSCTGCIKFENQLGGTSVLLQVYIFSQIEGWRYLRALKGLTPNSRNSDKYNKGLETLKLLCEKPMGMKVLKRRKRAANSYCKATMILFNICELRYVDCR